MRFWARSSRWFMMLPGACGPGVTVTLWIIAGVGKGAAVSKAGRHALAPVQTHVQAFAVHAQDGRGDVGPCFLRLRRPKHQACPAFALAQRFKFQFQGLLPGFRVSSGRSSGFIQRWYTSRAYPSVTYRPMPVKASPSAQITPS
jgi:hypothetical protein